MENVADMQIQKRLLNLTITDPKLFERVKRGNVDLFDGNKIYGEVYSAIKQFRKENKLEVPTKDTLDTIIQEKLDRKKTPEQERVPYSDALDEVYSVSAEDVNLNKPKILDYVKRQRMFKELTLVAANDLSPESLNKFDKAYEDIKIDTSTASTSDILDVFAIENKDEVAKSIEDVTTNVVSTGSEFFDKLTGGGLARGELGALAAPSGMGKSMSMVSLATSYITTGKDVLYVALEELTGRMVLRVAKSVLGAINSTHKDIIPDDILSKLTFNDKIEETLSTGLYHKLVAKYEEATGIKMGRFIFTRYSPHTLSIDDLRQVVSDTIITEGHHVDVLMVDYPDLLKAQGVVDNEAIVGGHLYEGVRAITQDFDLVGWVVSQVNRGFSQQDIIDRGSLEGSYRKINATEMFAFIQKSNVEFENNLIRVYIDKSRNGVSGDMVYGKVGRFTKFIELEDENEQRLHESMLNGGKSEEPEYLGNLKQYAQENNSANGEFAMRVNKKMKG